MSKTTSNILGIAAITGAVGLGISLYSASHKSLLNSKTIRKNVNKAAKNIASFVDDVSSAVR